MNMKALAVLLLALAGTVTACTSDGHVMHQARPRTAASLRTTADTPAQRALVSWWQGYGKQDLFYITGDAQRAGNAIRQGDAPVARSHCEQVDADTTGLPGPAEQKLARIPDDNAVMLAFDNAISYYQGAAQVCEQTAGQPASAVQADLSIAAGEFSKAAGYVRGLMSYLPGGRNWAGP